MQVNITVKGLEGSGKSDSIRNYITEGFAKVEDFLNRESWEPISVELLANVSALHAKHEFEVHISAAHFKVIVKKEGSDLYQLITKVMDITLEDLHKHKRKMVDKKKHGDDGFNRPG